AAEARVGDHGHLVLLVGPVTAMGAGGGGQSESGCGRWVHAKTILVRPLALVPDTLGWMKNFTRCSGGSLSCAWSTPTWTR
ncbi:hypothetical protein NL459_28635, partial [Klebsiella pneumoniae]|nr:hypothetical protein [Klebsiella pneumoniae]